MIQQYNIHNFKIHGDTTLNLGALTILTGMNGMGKSSFIQTMLVLRNSFLTHRLPNALNLKGDAFLLSGSASLVNSNVSAGTDELRISLHSSNGDNYIFEFQYPISNQTRLVCLPHAIQYTEEDMQRLSLFNKHFQYLSAFREGPKPKYDSDTTVVDDENQLSGSMGRGEFAVYFLSKYGNEDIHLKGLAYQEKATDFSLRAQVEAWLTEISPNIKMNIEQNGSSYILKYGYPQEGKTIRWYEATDNGYGISYVLSILVAILSAEAGALILIENPEAHIHPSAQAALMRLIAKAAGCGIQIILETHSDHIINGALVGMKKGYMSRNDLSIYYFQRSEETMNAEAIALKIGDSGRIVNAPTGFSLVCGIS